MSKSLKKAFAMILGFFLLLWAGIAYTLTLAFSQFEPVIDPDYSIKKPRVHAAAVHESRSKWSLTSPVFSRDQIERGELTLPLALASKTGARPTQGSIEVKLERPATVRGGSKRTLDLKDARVDADGTYHFESKFPVPASGFWEIQARAKIDGQQAIFVRHRMYAQ